MPDATGAAAPLAMLAEIRDGLSRPQKELPPRYFYDRRGSELFEAITELPEYYLTRAERGLLERWMPGWTAALRPRSLVELGAGSAAKTRVVLDAMVAAAGRAAYVPVDVSAEFLAQTAREIGDEYPSVAVLPVAADMTAPFPLPSRLPGPVLHAFLGSTIGNFPAGEAVALLRSIRGRMGAEDRLLLGVDLRKDAATLEAAYDDAAGVTAEFNRNMLLVLNREAGADFDPEGFDHRAFYHPELHRIEMHLVSRRAQRVTVPGAGTFDFAAGETLRTEVSCKHDRASMDEAFAAAGLAVERWETDDAGRYALLLGAPCR